MTHCPLERLTSVPSQWDWDKDILILKYSKMFDSLINQKFTYNYT